MIVAREDVSLMHQATGAWGRKTLDQVLRAHADATPDKIAVADFSDRSDWTTGAPLELTYAELARRVDTYASFFAALGLNPDHVVGLQMPPTVDAVAAFLALSRAGLVAAPMPLALGTDDLSARLGALGAKAIVTQAEVLGEPIGTRMRDVAAELFNIRFVFCAGDAVPDGLVELTRVMAEADSLPPPPELQRRGNSADHAVSVTLLDPDRTGTAVPVPRSHNHWLATGQMMQIEALIGADSVVVSPFALSGLVGIGGALAPSLLAGARLVLGLPASVDRLVEEMERAGATHVLIPASLARRLVERMEAARLRAAVIVVDRDGTDGTIDIRGPRIVDMITLGEMGLLARRRRSADLPTIPIGLVRAPADSSVAPILIETRLQATARRAGDGGLTTAEITVRGAMVPDIAWPPNGHETASPLAADGFMPTGRSATLVTTSPATAVVEPGDADHVGTGPTAISLAEIDAMIAGLPGLEDAAAIPTEGPDSGYIAAVVPSAGAFVDPGAMLTAMTAMPIGRNRVPDAIVPVAAIPRDATGAVLRRELAEHLRA